MRNLSIKMFANTRKWRTNLIVTYIYRQRSLCEVVCVFECLRSSLGPLPCFVISARNLSKCLKIYSFSFYSILLYFILLVSLLLLFLLNWKFGKSFQIGRDALLIFRKYKLLLDWFWLACVRVCVYVCEGLRILTKFKFVYELSERAHKNARHYF